MPDLSRREFIQDSTVIAAGLAVARIGASGQCASAAEDQRARSEEFASRWDQCHDRVWLGPEYWANPLQDWRIADGRIECVNPALDRSVHVITRQLGDGRGRLEARVRIGRAGGEPLGKGRGSAGFRIGIQGPLREYRNSLIFGSGLDAGITSEGRLFIGRLPSSEAPAVPLDGESVDLVLTAGPEGDRYEVTLTARHPESGKELGQVTQEVGADRLVGNLALVANSGAAGRGRTQVGPPEANAGTGKFWFADWKISGDKVEAHEDRAFGPILFSHYTLSEGVMTITAQMPPLGEKDSQTVRLQIAKGESGEWETIGEESIHPQARTATFRVENWDGKRHVPYRLAYSLTYSGRDPEEHYWSGTIRRDPVDQPVLTVADISCNIHAAFPNAHYVANLAKLEPDLVAFVGDQFYESTGGYGVVREPLEPAILDYLRKWYIHGWTWRELARDRPSISIPDDHDVYQGNIWGERGAPQEGTQEMGGYRMHPEWVNVVHRTQTAHHPAPYDPTPVKQGISVYYGPLTYGRVSFAILADRQFKTGPQGVAPPTGSRGDHVVDPEFDPQTADVPGAELLGERQMEFLRDWASDWRGADMKAVLSQTIFTGMATTHGAERMRLYADYDANGWPQSARNQALREIRKCFAVHLAGDQHLPAVVHYGIDEHNDAGVAFAGPAVNVGYPRWWEPEEPGRNRKPGAPEQTGEFTDHFGHPLTVLAVKNGAIDPRRTVLELLQDKASGLGVVRFDKARRRVTIDCWPFLADPTTDEQFLGWPVTVEMLDNYGRKPAAWLPKLEIAGAENPVVQVVDENNREIVYTLRIAGNTFQPHVFGEGTYTVRVSEPESGRKAERSGIKASSPNRETLRLTL